MCVRPTSPSDRPVLTRRPTAPHPELRRLGGSRRWPATTCPSSRVRPDAPAARTARAARVAFRRSVSFSHGATRQAQVGRRFRRSVSFSHGATRQSTSRSSFSSKARSKMDAKRQLASAVLSVGKLWEYRTSKGVSFRPGATRKNRAKRSFFFGGFFSRVRAVAVARTSRALSCLRAG